MRSRSVRESADGVGATIDRACRFAPLAALLVLGLWSCRTPAPTSALDGPDLGRTELAGLDGGLRSPFDELDAGATALVVVFVSTTCPIANVTAPALAELAAQAEGRGAAFVQVFVDPALSAEQAREHMRSHGLPGRALLDPGQVLASSFAVRATPEAFVFDAAGALAYRGRIDDLYWQPGRRRRVPTTRDLGDALDAVLAGRRPPQVRTEVVGCRLPLPAAPFEEASSR